jgi:hypothetical protein
VSQIYSSVCPLQSAIGSVVREYVAHDFIRFFHSCSIYAQKVVDQFANAEISAYKSSDEPRVMEFPLHGAVHSDLKHIDAGTPSTFMAAKHYGSESRQRRDELLAKFAAEKSVEAVEKSVEVE